MKKMAYMILSLEDPLTTLHGDQGCFALWSMVPPPALSYIQTHRCTPTHIRTPSHTLNIIIKVEIFWSTSKYWGRQLSPFDIFSLPGYICSAIFTYAGISVVCQFSLWGCRVCRNDAQCRLHIWQGKCLIFAWTKLMWEEYVSYLSW